MKKIAVYIAGCVIAVLCMFSSIFLIAVVAGEPLNYDLDILSWILTLTGGLIIGFFLSRDKLSNSRSSGPGS